MVTTVVGYMAELVEDIRARYEPGVKPLETEPPAESPWYSMASVLRNDASNSGLRDRRPSPSLTESPVNYLKDPMKLQTKSPSSPAQPRDRRGAGQGIRQGGREGGRDRLLRRILGEAVAQEIRGAGGERIFVRCDVSRRPTSIDVIAETLKAYGTVDIVVNNAGVNCMPRRLLRHHRGGLGLGDGRRSQGRRF